MGQPSGEEETIGRRIRRLRLKRGLSQRQLAVPGVSYAYISRIESGDRKPSLKVMRILARRLGVSLEELETGRRVPAAADRELRVSDAELALRLGGDDLAIAEETFRTILDDEDAERPLVARALAGLGLLGARRGDREAEVEFLERAIDTGQMPPEERPEVYEELAQALAFTDSPGRAIVLLEQALVEVRARASRNVPLEARFMAYLACAYSNAGDAGRATRLLREAAEKVEALASPQARVRVYWSLARLAWWDAQDPDTALRYAREALALYRMTEDTRGLALAHLLNASLLNLERNWRQAARHLERADFILTATGASPQERGVLRAEQAKVAAWSGDGEKALRLAKEADELLRDEHMQDGPRWHAYAAAHAALGDAATAEPFFQRALDFLIEHRQWREAAMLAREWADLHKSLGQIDRALELMERASGFSFRIAPTSPEPKPRRSRA
jgi:transcriptional regulator with XRE-family HTH domain